MNHSVVAPSASKSGQLSIFGGLSAEAGWPPRCGFGWPAWAEDGLDGLVGTVQLSDSSVGF